MPCSPSMYVIELRHAPVFPKPGSNVTIPVFARSWLMSTATSSSVPRRTGIADLGAGGRRITPATICLDFAAGKGTDVVGDVQRLPFRDASLDLVFATGLLEHVEDERLVISEIARVLRTGGLVHVEIPFLEQYHEDPI